MVRLCRGSAFTTPDLAPSQQLLVPTSGRYGIDRGQPLHGNFGCLLGMRPDILGNGDDGRPFEFTYLLLFQKQFLGRVVNELHSRIDFLKKVDMPLALQPSHDNLDNGECHLAQRDDVLIAMDSILEVGLGDSIQAMPFQDIDKQPGFDPISGEERQLLKQPAPPGHFAGQRLDQTRELRIEQIDQWPRREFGDAAPARRQRAFAEVQWTPVIAFDKLKPRLREQRPQDAVYEFGVDVGDIAVDPHDDITAGDMQTLP